MPKPASEKTGLVRKLANNSVYLRAGVFILVLVTVGLAVALNTNSSPKTRTASSGSMSACGNYRNDGQVRINGANINVEIPKSPSEFAKGLGGRPCILPNQGMLFAFTKPGQYPMWMKDMKFPVDIIWIGADHKVVGFYNDITPSTYPDSFVNKKDSPASYVLELKDKRASELYLTIGTPVSF
jgi:uncharacterized membrane protein (UPF0127 family)